MNMKDDSKEVCAILNDVLLLLEEAINLFPNVKYEHQQQAPEFPIVEAKEKLEQLLSELEY